MKIRNVLAVGMMVIGLSLAGCAKKQTTDTGTDTGGVTDTGVTGDNMGLQDSDSNNAMGMQTIYFPFDSFEIVGENRETLKNNIKILKDNPTVNIQVEGHCDERGGIQYNLALGEKRANAVKAQLAAGGIAGSRVTIISMGKEKPIDPSSGEAAWAKNRRANFVITSK